MNQFQRFTQEVNDAEAEGLVRHRILGRGKTIDGQISLKPDLKEEHIQEALKALRSKYSRMRFEYDSKSPVIYYSYR